MARIIIGIMTAALLLTVDASASANQGAPVAPVTESPSLPAGVTPQSPPPPISDAEVVSSCQKFLKMTTVQQAMTAKRSHFTAAQERWACKLLVSQDAAAKSESHCEIGSGGLVVGRVNGDLVDDGGLVIAKIYRTADGSVVEQGGLVVARIEGGVVLDSSRFRVGSVIRGEVVDKSGLIVGSTSGCTQAQAAAGAFVFIFEKQIP